MKKKKILFLLEAFDKGGIEKVTLDIVNHLDPQKYEITVQTFWYGGHCQSLVHENVRVVPFFFKRYVRGIIRLIQYLSPGLLYRLFVHGDYDVEIAASDGGAAKVISGSTNKKAKKICWVHMDVVNRGSKLKEFEHAAAARHIYDKFDMIACVSSPCRDKFIEKFGCYPHMAVAHNPIPCEEIQALAAAFRPFEKESGIFRFASVGRLEVEKGYDRLIDAAAQLQNAGYQNFEINIIGDGGQKDNLADMIDHHRLNGTVNLLGFAENPYPYISQSDFLVCSSHDEAFPLVIGESLVLGTPVLATRCAGTIEWLGDCEYGMLVENSTDALCQGLRRILDDTNASVELWAAKGHRKMERMTMSSQMSKWSKLMLDGD